MDSRFAAAPGAAGRPRAVTVSSYLLFAVAALSVVDAVVSLSLIGRIADVYRDAYAGSAGDGAEAFLVGVSVIGTAINIIFAVALVILALFNNRGRNPARITTWVIGGISLCCSGLGLLGNAATNSLNGPGTAGTPDPQEIQRRLDEALPSWYGPLTTTLSVVVLLAVLAALILLALPAANAFFRRPASGWEPAVPNAPYPGYPGPYPYAAQPYPGLPYPGQQPSAGQPPYPGQQPSAGQPPYPGQQASYPGQAPYPGQQPSAGPPPYPGQGQPSPGQPGHPEQPGQPAYPGQQPQWGQPAEPAGPRPDEPHSGSLPPTDPWSARSDGPAPDRSAPDRPVPEPPAADRPRPDDRPPADPPSVV